MSRQCKTSFQFDEIFDTIFENYNFSWLCIFAVKKSSNWRAISTALLEWKQTSTIFFLSIFMIWKVCLHYVEAEQISIQFDEFFDTIFENYNFSWLWIFDVKNSSNWRAISTAWLQCKQTLMIFFFDFRDLKSLFTFWLRNGELPSIWRFFDTISDIWKL